MDCEFSAFVLMAVEKIGNKTKLRHTEIGFELGPTLDIEAYLNNVGGPNHNGYQVMLNCFIQGLITAVKNAHAEGIRDEVESMKYIMDELGRSFAYAHHEVPEPDKNTENG